MSNVRVPFIPIALAFVCMLLSYNCWILSSQNTELSNAIGELQLKNRESSSEISKHLTKIKGLEDMKNKLMVADANYNQKEKELKGELADLEENEEELVQQLEDKDEIVKLLQDETDSLKAEVTQKGEEIIQLKSQLGMPAAADDAKDSKPQVDDTAKQEPLAEAASEVIPEGEDKAEPSEVNPEKEDKEEAPADAAKPDVPSEPSKEAAVPAEVVKEEAENKEEKTEVTEEKPVEKDAPTTIDEAKATEDTENPETKDKPT